MKQYLSTPLSRKICWSYLLLFAVVVPFGYAEPGLASLQPNAQQTFLDSMDWGDRYWDSQSKFLRAPASEPLATLGRSPRFLVRESSWYALGLLLRNRQGDQARALETLDAVLAQQYNEPGKPWDGTFRRTPQEPEPPENAVMWKDYDPNWREFIGSTFAMILEEYPHRIPKEMAHRMDDSIVRAIDGEIKNLRLVPTYTNPALMYGFLWNFAAVRSHRADWIKQSTDWQESVYALFKKFGTFSEYNSPTYCGVDLYALSLWRRYGATPHIRAIGSEMEAGLWRDLAAFYNANLRNISGPFDRAYGMDMESYISVVGLALRTVLDANQAPFPKLDPPVDHVDDLWFAPQFAILGVQVPADAMQQFRTFQGERQVRRQIDEQRVATAWIGREIIYGGESTTKSRDVGAHSQFHPATVQWRTPSGKIGWIQLTKSPPLDAGADKSGLKISCAGDVHFRIYAPGVRIAGVKQKDWALPGLTVHVEADTRNFAVESGADAIELEYSGITGMTLTFEFPQR